MARLALQFLFLKIKPTMRHLQILLIFLFLNSLVIAQETKTQDSIKSWHKEGKATLLFNQSSFSNWISGGENAIAANLNFNYIFNYKKGNWTWNNTVKANYGLNYTNTNGTRKTEDRVELNTLIGYKKDKNWYYSFFFNFQTQFANGYDYKKDPEAKIPISKSFAPAYLNFGPGVFYEKTENLKINISPATSKITIVTDDDLSSLGAFGLSPGEKIKHDLGFSTSVFHKTIILENVEMVNNLNLYANYFNNFKNIDFDYQLKFVMTVNKYISTNINFQAIYNDEALARLQFKEVFGIGINYNL